MPTPAAVWLATVLGGALLVAGPPHADPPPNPADGARRAGEAAYAFDVVDANISGGAGNRGSAAALDRVAQVVDRSRPDAVTLQEVCRSQYDALGRLPELRGWHLTYYPQRAHSPECGDDAGATDLGLVVASPWVLHELTPVDLPEDEHGRDFAMLCAGLDLPDHRQGAVRVCTVHLLARDRDATTDERPRRATQTAAVRAALHPLVDRDERAVVLTGDFNSGPQQEAMTNVYWLPTSPTVEPYGDFHEADEADADSFRHARPPVQCGETACRTGGWTHRSPTGRWTHKLDYVYFSRNAVVGEPPSAVLVPNRSSDHRIYLARADLQLRD